MSLGDLFRELGLFTALATVIALPVIAVSYRRGELSMLRRFLVAAVLIAVAVTVLSVTSDMLVPRCLDAGNTGCIDYGAAGFETLILTLFAVVSLITTVRLIRD